MNLLKFLTLTDTLWAGPSCRRHLSDRLFQKTNYSDKLFDIWQTCMWGNTNKTRIQKLISILQNKLSAQCHLNQNSTTPNQFFKI